MTTPIDRLDHIEQILVRMRPTMGYELGGAAAIRAELAALREIFAPLNQVVEAVTCPACGREYQTSGCCECPFCTHEWDDTKGLSVGPASLEAMTRVALNGDTCG
ncbi:MAG: hypothetical protein AB1413_12490 [Thermodesulfobacteriota bacterium]